MAGKLTVVAVKALVAKGKPARHADGANLYLAITGPGAAKWTFRFMLAGKAREMGLGAYDASGASGSTLAEARSAADAARRLLRDGIDPVAHRQAAAHASKEAAAKAHVFREVAEMLLGAHEAGWKNAKHRAQWRSTLETYVYPTIGDTPVAEVSTDHVLRILQPIWTQKTETASRLRGRIEAVLDYATARGWRSGPNPAMWRGHLQTMLPKKSKVAAVKHHAALPWQEMGSFLLQLRSMRATAARAMEFAILTAARTGEVLGARWSEIDLSGATWIVPGARMKAGKEHRVPLSDAALAILEGMLPLRPEQGDGYVFPGQGEGKPLSQMALLMALRRMGRADLTCHGFRSTFRDWVEEGTSTPHAVAEAALAHTISNKVEAAYRRGDLFQKRASLMQDWANYCAKKPAEVVLLKNVI